MCVQHFQLLLKRICLWNVPCYGLTKSLTIPKDIIFIEEREEEEEETAETKILFFYLCARRASTASTASVTALLRAGMPGCSSSCSRVNLKKWLLGLKTYPYQG